MLAGRALNASDDEWYDAVYGLAAGDLSEEEFTQWLRDHLAGEA